MGIFGQRCSTARHRRVAQVSPRTYIPLNLSSSGCPTSRAFRDVGNDAADTLSLQPHHRTNLQFEYTPVIHFHHTGFTQRVGAITAPMPQFRRLHQPSLHWIPMHITQLLFALFRAPHIEVIEARLPHMLRRVRKPFTLCGVR
jgi:hypothetical protein